MLEHRFSRRFGDDAFQDAKGLALTPTDEVVIGAYVEGAIDFGNGTLTAIGSDETGDVGLAKLAGH